MKTILGPSPLGDGIPAIAVVAVEGGKKLRIRNLVGWKNALVGTNVTRGLPI